MSVRLSAPKAPGWYSMRNRKPRGDNREPKGAGHGDWLYGRRPVVEALRANKRHFFELRILESALKDSGDSSDIYEIRDLASSAGITVVPTDRRDFENLLGPVNHQGVALKTGSFPYSGFDQLIFAVKNNPQATVLVLDHIEDPQNVGSLLRTSDAAGVAGVIIPEDRCAGVTSAAVRASAGASEHLCVVKVVNLARAIDELKENECWVTGLDWGDDARAYTDIDYKGRCAIVVGNEGRGISRLVREKCDFIAELPMLGSVSSLNASVAGAIVLYETVRQKSGQIAD